METDLNTIHVFKTNIKNADPSCELHKTLNSHSDIAEWTIDHEDVDCVLRIVSDVLKPEIIITMITTLGHECQELS